MIKFALKQFNFFYSFREFIYLNSRMQNNTKIYRNIDFDEPTRRNRIEYGEFAEVFKLQEKKTGITYAIKIFFDDNRSQKNPEFRNFF